MAKAHSEITITMDDKAQALLELRKKELRMEWVRVAAYWAFVVTFAAWLAFEICK